MLIIALKKIFMIIKQQKKLKQHDVNEYDYHCMSFVKCLHTRSWWIILQCINFSLIMTILLSTNDIIYAFFKNSNDNYTQEVGFFRKIIKKLSKLCTIFNFGKTRQKLIDAFSQLVYCVNKKIVKIKKNLKAICKFILKSHKKYIDNVGSTSDAYDY